MDVVGVLYDMVPSNQISRRRVVAAGAALGLGVLARPVLPAFGAAGGSTDSSSLAIPAGAVRRSGSRIFDAPSDFQLLGVSGDGLVHAHLQVRTRPRGGSWSRWTELHSAADHAPDGGTARKATDPVWTGPARQVQLRAGRSLGALRIHFVSVAAHGVVARAAGAHAASVTKHTVAGSPLFVARSTWGAGRYPPRDDPSYGRVDLAMVHHAETPNDYSASESASIVLGIDNYHRNTLGWSDIGYNFLVDKYGTIFEGRYGGVDKAVIGAQAQGYNSFSTGICCIGNYMSTPLPAAAMDAVARIIAWKLPLHDAPVTGTLTVTSGGGSLNAHPYGAKVKMHRIAGHRDGDSTDCPGDRLYAELPTLRTKTAALVGKEPTDTPPTTPAAPVSLTIVPAAKKPRYMSRLIVRGALMDANDKPVVGKGVVVEKQGKSGRWIKIASARTTATGHWGTSATWKAAGTLRARAKVSHVQVISPSVAVGLRAARR
jgi:hypothetical protein